jgi:SNF family Na+-dependent transporter
MNKVIFQIGILGFCIAAVVYGGSGGSILDIVSRSFIVFIGIVLAAMVVVLVGGTMLEKNKAQRTGNQEQTPQTQ